MEDPFIHRVVEQLGDFRGLVCHPMFGGHGLFRGRLLFGIVAAGRLYLKTGDATAGEYVRRGMKPLRAGDGHDVLRTYYEVPAEVVHDRRQLHEWADAAATCAAKRQAAAAPPTRGAAYPLPGGACGPVVGRPVPQFPR